MSHGTGSVLAVSPVITIGPDAGPQTSPNTWALAFSHTPAPSTPAPGGTKLLLIHFINAQFPANNRLEVDLGYDTDVFTSADGSTFWTRPVDISKFAGGNVPIRYITDGAATGSVQIDQYGRGERHAATKPGHTSMSNCDPFLIHGDYTEPQYDPFWFCDTNPSPNWENVANVPAGDIRRTIARSVGMFIGVDGDHLSTCTVTLIDEDLVISAGHCANPPLTSLPSMSVCFDYQTEADGSKPAGYDARFYKVVKITKWRFDYIDLDYCIMQIKIPPGGLGIPAIPLRHTLPAINEQVFGIHHPNGAVKKLSIPHPGYARVLSTGPVSGCSPDTYGIGCRFDVSGGSSGSGLFDTSGRLVGILSGCQCPFYYTPTASILLDIANTPGDPGTGAPQLPGTQDVMLVFDRSGSMSLGAGTGKTKIEEAREAASLFVELVRSNAGNRTGLVSYSTSASVPVDFGIAPVNAANKNTLIGPAPFTTGIVGSLSPGGLTSIGGGLAAARGQFPTPGANPRTILLLTDGLQNTIPMIEDVEPSLAGIGIHAIGFGTESSLNGALLSGLAQSHDGLYTRAGSGLSLKKFFALAFGDIFESGALTDPERFLPKDQRVAEPVSFFVCGEETITAVIGWEPDAARLGIQLRTPGGATVNAASPGVEQSAGRSWSFLRVPLPYQTERDGEWQLIVFRTGGDVEFPPPAVDVTYFFSIIANGGPILRRFEPGRNRRYYTGDAINPRVWLKYTNGVKTDNASVELTITHPSDSVGNILSESTLGPQVEIDGDVLPARYATLTGLEEEAGEPVVTYVTETHDLFDDGSHSDGAMEEDGIFGNVLADVLRTEGNYSFHAKARYGESCRAMRETIWSIHVETGIDPSGTGIGTTVVETLPDGRQRVQIVLDPRDVYGNRLGPGRADAFTAGGSAGSTVDGPVSDNGDGTYGVVVVWDPATGRPPGVIIGQPGRDPVDISKPPGAGEAGCRAWVLWIALLLFVVLCWLVFLLLW